MKSIAAFLVLAAIWFSGLLAFADRVQDQTPARAPKPAEGIVALTGAGSNQRLSAAVGLLEDGYGRRVLVSGDTQRIRKNSKSGNIDFMRVESGADTEILTVSLFGGTVEAEAQSFHLTEAGQ